MNQSGNTILITGGGSGIGRGLAEAFQKAGNQVVIAGRRQHALDEVTAANPGMRSATLDIESPAAVRAFAAKLTAGFPQLNVVVHNAGIMRPEKLLEQPADVPDAEAIIATNLLGPIRLTAALLPHLLKQPRSAILTVSSGLAFVPLSMTPTYCATKAAVHSYTVSLRQQLHGTTTEVIELIPPYVQTHLMGAHQAADPRAMPLDEYLSETMRLLRQDPTPPEVIVERVKPLRLAAETGTFDKAFAMVNARH